MKNEIYNTDIFDNWLNGLKDHQARGLIVQRINRAKLGNWGDCKVIVGSGGLFEMRIDFGPGYRIYYGQIGQTSYLIMAGGVKRSQNADIAKAKAAWKQIKDLNYDPAKN